MIYFIFGDNSYDSWAEVEKLMQGYLKKGFAPKIYNADEAANLSDVFKSTENFGMFSNQELPVLKRATKNKSSKFADDMIEYLKLKYQQEMIMWEDGEVDKRRQLFKFIKTTDAKIIEFKPLSYRDLRSWLNKELKEREVKLENNLEELILATIGDDQGSISSELDKLALYARANKIEMINKKDLLEVLSESKEFDIWDFMTTVENGRRSERQKILNKLMEQGEEPLAILGMLGRHFRMLIEIRYLIDHKYAQPDIQKRLNLHPFVFRKAYPSARQFSQNRLERYYQKLLDTDLAIKEGKVSSKLGVTLFVGTL